MSKRKLYLAAFICAAFVANSAPAQEDFHLSQFQSAPLYFNPGQTGMFADIKGDYRGTAVYRSQWRALGSKPFATAYIGYDMPLRKYDKKFGVGGYIVDNNAMAGQYNTLNVMGSGAYNIMDGTDEHYLSAGLQMGILYKSFNPANYTYDIQYNSSTGDFDQTISSMETWSRTSLVRFDANLGVYYKYLPTGKKYKPAAGLAVYHLTKPNESFTSRKSRLPMRFVFHTLCDFKLNDDFILQPHFLYMNQAKAYEANIGALLFYKIKNSSMEVLGGVDYRVKDAIVAHIGFRQENHYFRFSYDINTSSLNNYTGGRGAWEFSLVLVGKFDTPMFKPMF